MLPFRDLSEIVLRPSCFGTAEIMQVQMAFEDIYKVLRFPKPQVICFESPYQLQVAIKRSLQKPIPFLLDNINFKALDKMLWNGLNPKSINKEFWSLVSHQIARPLFLAFGEEESISAHMQELKPRFQEIDDAVGKEFLRLFKPEGLSPEPIAHHPHWFDQKWLSFYNAKVSEIPLAKIYQTILKNGLMYAYCFNDLVLWCPRPQSLSSSHRGLHHEHGPALAWADEFKMYYWHGKAVPAKLILAPESIDKKDVRTIDNVELRNAFLAKLGKERFAGLFDLELVDSDRDSNGNLQELYRSREFDSLNKEYLQFAKLIHAENGEEFFISVPAGIKNVWEAVFWSINNSAQFKVVPSKQGNSL